MRIRFAAMLALVLAGSVLGPSSVHADAAHAARVAPVVARALAYDRTLEGRAGGSVDIVVLHAQGNAPSLAEAHGFERAFAAMSGTSVQGMPLRVRVVAYSAAALEAAITQGGDAVLLCAGLEAQATSIAAISRRRRVLSMGSSRAFAEVATTLAFVVEDGRPRVVANLTHARAEGVQLASQLLRLSEIL